MPIWIRISTGIYRFLQRAYPAEFREIYGEEMSRAFAEGCRDSRRLGIVKLVRFLAVVLSDWTKTAPQEHIDRLRQDLRYSVTTLIRSKTFALTAIICLSLGIGATSTLFTTASTLLTRPLPVADPERVVMFRSSDGSDIPYPEYLRFRDMNQSFEALTGWFPTPVSVGYGRQSEIVVGEIVAGNYFDTLGVKPAIGRTFIPEEDETPDKHPVVVIGDALWKQEFGGDPEIIGRTVTLNGQPFSVIGVMPPSFTGSAFMLKVELWAPMMMSGRLNWGGGPLNRLQVMVLGRLKPAISVEQAAADANRMRAVIDSERPERREISSTLSVFRPAGVFLTKERRRIESVTILLSVVVGIILLIACSNVAGLLIVRASSRRQEIAVRVAAGASDVRLMRQLLTESLVLSAAGAIGGLLLTMWLTRIFSSYRIPIPGPYAPYVQFVIDSRSVAFTAVISTLTGLLFGMAPAWRASRANIALALKIGGSVAAASYQRSRLRSLLLVTQIAMSFVLLVGAGLFIRSLFNAARTDPGFETDNVVLASVNVGLQGYTPPRGRQFYQQLQDRLRALPGVRTVSTGRPLPLSGSDGRATLVVEASANQQPVTVAATGADVGYFDVLRIPIVRGRPFSSLDTRNTPRVVVISESLERKLFPGMDAIGRRLRTPGPQAQTFEIIGVAKDIAFGSLEEDAQPRIYDSFQQSYSPTQSVLVATSSDPIAVRNLIKNEIHAIDPNLPVEVKTMQEHLAYSVWPARVGAVVLGSMGALAILLACVGIYSVTAYSVVQRTREFGTRLALGARRIDVVRMVVHEGMRLAIIGASLGLAVAIFVVRPISSFLYGTSPLDPITFLTVPFLLLVVTLVANYLPARRASSVDPIVALRSE